MTHDPVTQYHLSTAQHRARIHDAALRRLAAGTRDRHWLRRPSRQR